MKALVDKIRAALGILKAEPRGQEVVGYRVEPTTQAEAVRDIERHTRALAMRVYVLEQQLAAKGIEPAQTPSRVELRRIEYLLECLGRAQHHNMSVNEIRALGSFLQGLTTWGEGPK